MKKAVILVFILILTPFMLCSQNIKEIEYISPFNDGVSAIKKGNQWAFIDTVGTIVVPFRDDLATTKTNGSTYPIFSNNRCLIIQKKDGISYYGYIDKHGNTVIKPQFLNATNFKNNVALALELVKENAGQNELLGKNIVYYKYYEVVLNTSGKVETYISDPINIVLDKKHLSKPPMIMSKLLSDKLIATKSKTKTWELIKLDN